MADHIERLRHLAPIVAKQDQEFVSAARSEEETEASLLSEVLAIVKPALPAIVPPKAGKLMLGDTIGVDEAGVLRDGDMPITPLDAVADLGIGQILDVLTRILDSHAKGKKAQRTAEIRLRAERLEAIRLLVAAIRR